MSESGDSFEAMYKEHYRMLRRAAQNIIGDSDAAHDVVQEVFVRIWNRRAEVAAIINQKAYLYKAVVNSSLSFLESNKGKTNITGLYIETSETAESEIMLKELQQKVQKALNALPPKCRAIFVLSRTEGLKNREIAEVLNLSIKTVENQMGIALKKMKEDLKPYLRGDYIPLILMLTSGMLTIADLSHFI